MVLNVEKRHEYQASGNLSPNPGPRLSAHRDLSFTFLFKKVIIKSFLGGLSSFYTYGGCHHTQASRELRLGFRKGRVWGAESEGVWHPGAPGFFVPFTVMDQWIQRVVYSDSQVYFLY